MSDNDLSGRLLAPVIALPRLPLSNKASTDSCNIRFSFLTIISGARNSINLLSLLFLLITLRYKSLRSDVANLPPSNGTRGRNSGGITGTASKIIHSGRAPEFKKASTNLSRFTYFLRLASEFVSLRSTFKVLSSSSRSISLSISRIISAPIPA